MRHEIKRDIELRRLAGRVLRKYKDEFEDILAFKPRIAYLYSDEEKKKRNKVILAECIPVSSQYQWCCHYDFMIVFYEPNIDMLTDDQMETLMRHELHHVGIDFSGTEPSYYSVPHDYEEFEAIIEDKGLKWT